VRIIPPTFSHRLQRRIFAGVGIAAFILLMAAAVHYRNIEGEFRHAKSRLVAKANCFTADRINWQADQFALAMDSHLKSAKAPFGAALIAANALAATDPEAAVEACAAAAAEWRSGVAALVSDWQRRYDESDSTRLMSPLLTCVIISVVIGWLMLCMTTGRRVPIEYTREQIEALEAAGRADEILNSNEPREPVCTDMQVSLFEHVYPPR
jgi:hypothetical protein